MGALRWWAHQQSPWYLSLRSGAGLWGCQCACGVSAAVCLLALLDVCFYWGTHNRKWPQLFRKQNKPKKTTHNLSYSPQRWRQSYLMSISAKLFASGAPSKKTPISLLVSTEAKTCHVRWPLVSPRSLLSLCSLLLLLSTSSPMKITTMPTNTQEIVTIIFKPSPPPELSLLTLGAFTRGAMVPVQRWRCVLLQVLLLDHEWLSDIIYATKTKKKITWHVSLNISYCRSVITQGNSC